MLRVGRELQVVDLATTDAVALRTQLRRATVRPVCLIGVGGTGPEQELPRAAMAYGVVALLWCRAEQYLAAFEADVPALLDRVTLPALPKRVQQIRERAAAGTGPAYGAHLTLVWLDASGSPPRIELQPR